MSEEHAYEVSVKSVDASGVTHEAHAEVRSSDPAETVARGILDTLQVQRGKGNVRIIDGDR